MSRSIVHHSHKQKGVLGIYEVFISPKTRHKSGKQHINRYPHEFSGGQRQRICIARSLILNPKLIIADEPVSALDVSIQSDIINLIKLLNNEDKVTFLFISHDLAVVKNLCNNVSVMKDGEIIETGDAKNIIDFPKEEYTKLLVDAVPKF